MPKVLIAPCFKYIRVDTSDILASFDRVEDHLPLALRATSWPRNSATINLVIDKWRAVNFPAYPPEPLSSEVKAVYVTAEVEVGLGLRYS